MPKYISLSSIANDYIQLKWPLIINTISLVVLIFMISITLQSPSWFTYESLAHDTEIVLINTSVKYPRMLEYGSIGLSSFCFTQIHNTYSECDPWLKEQRPALFTVIFILLACALFFANLAIFPSFASLILVIYNINNCYIAYMNISTWIIFGLLLAVTIMVISATTIAAVTQFYSPGLFFADSKYILFQTGSGLYCLIIALIISCVCLGAIIITLIWKKFISVQLLKHEKELLRRLDHEEFQPGWEKIIGIPNAQPSVDHHQTEPPPYNQYQE